MYTVKEVKIKPFPDYSTTPPESQPPPLLHTYLAEEHNTISSIASLLGCIKNIFVKSQTFGYFFFSKRRGKIGVTP